MPVTAKLSRKFYESMGDDVATELVEWFNSVDATYRGDIRELNELNFARFDAKLEQRIAQVQGQVAALEARVIGRMDARIEKLRAELVRWMFGAWSTVMLAVLGTLFAVLLKR